MSEDDDGEGLVVTRTTRGGAIHLAARMDGQALASAISDGRDHGGAVLRWRWCVDDRQAAAWLTARDAPARIDGAATEDEARQVLGSLSYAVLAVRGTLGMAALGSPYGGELAEAAITLVRIVARRSG